MRMVERLQSHEKAASELIIRTFIPSFLRWYDCLLGASYRSVVGLR
jgi:hypothetical protein